MIRLGVPSKGRLMDKTAQWFGERGIGLRRAGSERDYAAVAEGIDGLELILLSAGEIPRELAAGRLHLGVTGSDLVHEKVPLWELRLTELAAMGFGRADLVVAVPQAWVDVDTLDDLDAAAAAFRARHGHRLRIATKYHRLVREFLREHGVADYALVDSQGANRGHRWRRDGGGDRRHHLHRRDAAGERPEGPRRRADPFQPGDAVAVADGGLDRRGAADAEGPGGAPRGGVRPPPLTRERAVVTCGNSLLPPALSARRTGRGRPSEGE